MHIVLKPLYTGVQKKRIETGFNRNLGYFEPFENPDRMQNLKGRFQKTRTQQETVKIHKDQSSSGIRYSKIVLVKVRNSYNDYIGIL